MSRVRIADMVMDIESADKAFFDVRLSAYASDDTGEPDCRITTTLPTLIKLPDGQEILRRERLAVLKTADGNVCHYTRSDAGDILQAITQTPDFSHTDIQILSRRRHSALSLTDFEYLLTGNAFSNRLTVLGGLMLHSSALAFDGKGVAFSAPSGTGKSTHAALWRERYGKRVIAINDDKPAIRFKENTPWIYGTPWSGKTDLNNNVAVPLHAIVFLERSEYNEIVPLTPKEAIFYLMEETMRPYYDSELGVQVLETAQRLIQSVPIYRLRCTVSFDAVDLVKRELKW